MEKRKERKKEEKNNHRSIIDERAQRICIEFEIPHKN